MLPMATDMVDLATNEKLKELDWTKNIEICELVTSEPRQAKEVIKSIKKRLKNKNPNIQLFSVMLLEMLMNNCGDHIHRQVIDNGLLPILVKIVKKKIDLPVRERIFLLLDATQTALGGATGKFPQYYNAYYELVTAGVQFQPRRPHVTPPIVPTANTQEKVLSTLQTQLEKHENGERQVTAQLIPDSSIIQKASSAFEVLKDVLNALSPTHPEGVTDEFVLDLVEQCSFQKQRIMHLVMTSRDEKVISQAIELNEQLEQILDRHDSLLSVCATTTTTSVDEEPEEEEDAERLYRRIRKGKACAEDHSEDTLSSFRSIPEQKMRRPIIRPLSIHSSDADHRSSDPECRNPPPVSLPPPPARHMEREKFFKEKNIDSSGLAGHVRGLSLDSRNGSSSRSGSTDCSERDVFGF